MEIRNTFLLVLFLFFGQFTGITQVSTTAHDYIPPYNGSFGYGVNFGGYGTSSNVNVNGEFVPWLDEELAEIATGNPAAGIPGAGVTSVRLGFPDSFASQYGFDIRLQAFNRYNELGLKDHTMFLNGPAVAHRDLTEYCPGVPSAIFKNLHTPIWDNGANGTPYNDQNFYAKYVYETVATYGKWVKYWEVWNEPDFTDSTNSTADPGVPGNWWTNDPNPCELNGAFGIRAPISHYVRMLRITYEIVKTLYPESYVATGGLGYPSFLDAILRNTDNPNNGDVSAEYPLKGGAYFDVVSWHYYPHVDEAFKLWNQDILGFDYFRYSDAAYDEFIQRDREYEAVLESRGYNGTTFPRKLKINTETNLPRIEVLSTNSAGGNQLQANYNMKVMFASQAVGLDHLHLYHIGESRDENNVWLPQHQFDMMGLYKNLLTQNKNTAEHTPAGIGLKTMSDILKGYWYDAGKTNQLQLPSNVRGGAFSNANGETTYMLWARTFRDRSEEAFVTYTFPPSVPWTSNSSATLQKKGWNHFATNQTSTISFNNVQLNGNPAFFTLNSGTVSQCDGLTVNVNSEVPTCFGYTNGTISVSASNGVQPYTFLWQDGSGSPLQNNLVSGTYFVTVSDGAGCTVTQNIELNSPPAMNTSIQIRNETIAGLSNGSLTAFPSGGRPPYSYFWSNGVQSQTNQGLGAGTYSLTVNDSNGCPVIKQAVVEADDIGCGTFNLQLFDTDLSCFNANNGTISANATGGTGTISYKWNTGQITGFVQNLPTGTYRVTATDELGCSKVASTSITSPTQLSLFVAPTQPSAAGTDNGRASAFVNGGTPPYSYVWSNTQTSSTIENLAPGIYSVTITDNNGCQAVDQTEILSPEANCEDLEASIVFSDPRCPGTNTGFVSASPINGTPPFQFKWNTGATNQTIGNLPAGTYFVTITDAAQCSVQSAQTLSPKAPISIAVDINPASGNGINDGGAILNVSGGTAPYRAVWSNGLEGLTVTGLSPGAYNVTVFDFNNCQRLTQVIVESNDMGCAGFTDLFFQSQNIQCANENDGAIILLPQGGQAPFEYNWSNGATSQSISNLFAGNYTVTVTDVNGCFHIRTVNIVEPPALIGSIQAELTGNCGNIANLRAQGQGGTPPYDYNWNTGGENAAVFNLPGGLYRVTITDTNGCTFTDEFVFEEDNSFPGIGQNVEDITCNGEVDGSVEIEHLSGLAPFQYIWSNGSTSQDIGSLSAGVYDLTVVDANGCDSEHSFIVSEPNPLVIDFDVINPATQNDNGSIKANVFGGVQPYSYLWDFGANTEVINNVNIGTYSITITDANGCTQSDEVELNVTSTQQNITRNKGFKIFPNPTQNFFFIEIPNNESLPKQITLLDVHGKVITQDAYSQQGNLLRMDVQNILSGTYMLMIELEDGYTLGKRIILLDN